MKYLKYLVIFSVMFGFQLVTDQYFYAKKEFTTNNFVMYAISALATVSIIYLSEVWQSRKAQKSS